MKKTAFFAGVAIAAIAGGFFILQSQKVTEQNKLPQEAQTAETLPAEPKPPVQEVPAVPVEVPPVAPTVEPSVSTAPVPPPVDRTPESKNYSEAELKERKALAELKQEEIQRLMEEYNQNLSNPEKRKELQASINELMDQYNELVLPVALAEMKESNP